MPRRKQGEVTRKTMAARRAAQARGQAKARPSGGVGTSRRRPSSSSPGHLPSRSNPPLSAFLSSTPDPCSHREASRPSPATAGAGRQNQSARASWTNGVDAAFAEVLRSTSRFKLSFLMSTTMLEEGIQEYTGKVLDEMPTEDGLKVASIRNNILQQNSMGEGHSTVHRQGA